MGLDKFRGTTARHPWQPFFDRINADQKQPEDGRTFKIQWRGTPLLEVTPYAECAILFKHGWMKGTWLCLNFFVPGAGRHLPLDQADPTDLSKPTRQHRVVTVLECNPNKFPEGWASLQQVVDS